MRWDKIVKKTLKYTKYTNQKKIGKAPNVTLDCRVQKRKNVHFGQIT